MGVSAFVLSNFISSDEGVVHFFGTRTDPADLFSTVKVGQLTEGPPEFPRVASLKQVHGTDVRVFDQPSQVELQGLEPGDALVTNQPNLLVLVRTADCVPILVADMKRKVIAAIHAGWRGTLSGIVSKTLSVLHTQFDSQVNELTSGNWAVHWRVLFRGGRTGDAASSSNGTLLGRCGGAGRSGRQGHAQFKEIDRTAARSMWNSGDRYQPNRFLYQVPTGLVLLLSARGSGEWYDDEWNHVEWLKSNKLIP